MKKIQTSYFEEVVEKYRPRLIRQAGMIVGPRHAEDVVQEALIKAFRSWDKLREERYAGTWLSRITINEACEMRRKMQLERTYHESFDCLDESWADKYSRVLDGCMLQLIDEVSPILPPHYVTVLSLKGQGMTFKEIGQNLNVPESTIRCWFGKACKRIRAHFKQLGVVTFEGFVHTFVTLGF